MTSQEIDIIRDNNNYDAILSIFLNRHHDNDDKKVYDGPYSGEYCEARVKFNILIDKSCDNIIPHNLDYYVNNIIPKWSQIEWGFPKGRRETRFEDNITCACREFEEETGYNSSEYVVLNKIEPVEEIFKGTNGIYYKHIYYLSFDNAANNVDRDYDTVEIGKIKWFTYDEAILHIRPYHHAKKQILTQVYLFILNILMQSNYA